MKEIGMANNPFGTSDEEPGKQPATNRDRLPDHIKQVEQSDDVGPGSGGDRGMRQSGLESDAGSGTAGGGRDISRTGRGPAPDPSRPK
jgi:hypothetical protein